MTTKNLDFVSAIFYPMSEVKRKDDKVSKLLTKETISRVVLRVCLSKIHDKK